MRTLAFLIYILPILGCASAQKQDVLIDVQAINPNIQVELRYLTSENFIGRPIEGYKKNICYLSHSAADALGRVQERLAQQGYALRVYDGYRPDRAVKSFVEWSQDPTDQKMKAQYYPNIDKSKLIELGYISARSGHSRASTVDLTVVRYNKKQDSYEPLDMGGPYDFFGEVSHTQNTTISKRQKANRQLLVDAMAAEGFKNYNKEWWHYTLINEPYPDEYFDFVIE